LEAMKVSGVLTDGTRLRPEAFMEDRFVRSNTSLRMTPVDVKPKEPEAQATSVQNSVIAAIVLLAVVAGLIVLLRRKK